MRLGPAVPYPAQMDSVVVRPMREAMAWLQRYERLWTVSIDRLVALVEKDDA